jgi:AcrR family transcriptional regulator/DNA-binding MarR family transcriptional regulator
MTESTLELRDAPDGRVGPGRSRTVSSRAARNHVREAQRMRILSAAAYLAAEQGADVTAVTDVIGMAGVSRRTFYELFDDRGDCFLAAIEEAFAVAEERARPAYLAHERWVDSVRAGLAALLGLFDEQPQLARICVAQSASAGAAALLLRSEMLDQFAHVIDRGRAEARHHPPAVTAEGAVGGILSVIQTRLLAPEPAPLLELLNPLMSMIVLPYLGSAAARKELSRPTPVPCEPSSEAAQTPFEGLNIRLTYRTLAVLDAIAEEPGLSNKQIGERAGVTDQAQISRLLARLAYRGLMMNTGGGQPQGTTNAWRLTLIGEQLAASLRRQSLIAGR